MAQKFQIQLGGKWQDYADKENVLLHGAFEKGLADVTFTSRGQQYNICLKRMIQHNTASGKTRQIRPPLGIRKRHQISERTHEPEIQLQGDTPPEIDGFVDGQAAVGSSTDAPPHGPQAAGSSTDALPQAPPPSPPLPFTAAPPQGPQAAGLSTDALPQAPPPPPPPPFTDVAQGDAQNAEATLLVGCEDGCARQEFAAEQSSLSESCIAAELVSQGIEPEAFECPCCYDDVPRGKGVRPSPVGQGCGHAVCRTCFDRLVSGQLDDNQLCCCPMCPPSSQSLVPGWLVGRLLGREAAKKLAEIEQLHIGQVDGGKLRLWQCPTPDCQMRRAIREDWDPKKVHRRARIFDCKACKKKICLRCNVEEHAGFTCQQFTEWRRANDMADKSYAQLLRKGLIKPCPNCSAPVMKNDGCNFITCASCNSPNGMCWQTGKARWGPKGCGGGHNCH